MILPGFRFHHFGLAATRLEPAASALAALGYDVGERVHDPLQDVDLAWCTHAGFPSVEIVLPVSANGPLAQVLAQRESSFYHLCFEAEGLLEDAVAGLRESGLRVLPVREPRPALLFGGRRVSFQLIHGFGLVELLETPEAASD
jgi:methylmalonyl-CoA/ethylmalonyl-CoA epimerase